MKLRKIFNKRKTAIGLLATVTLFIWNPNILADDEATVNLIAVHDSSSRQYNKECISCHADILSAQSLQPPIPNVHVAMIPFTPGEKDEETCVVCHRTVDLVQPGQCVGIHQRNVVDPGDAGFFKDLTHLRCNRSRVALARLSQLGRQVKTS